MLRYPPKRRAIENKTPRAEPERAKDKPLKTKVIAAPQPDPRIVPSGTPAISYVLALGLLVVLALCAHLTNSLPAPGDQLVVPAGYFPTTGRSLGPPHAVPALTLGNVLAASGPACTLSEEALRADGGSFSVLAHRPDGVVVSWAGAPTAAASPCPAGTPLLVSQASYQSLRNWRPAPSYQR
jgi:hypothetical protein